MESEPACNGEGVCDADGVMDGEGLWQAASAISQLAPLAVASNRYPAAAACLRIPISPSLPV